MLDKPRGRKPWGVAGLFQRNNGLLKNLLIFFTLTTVISVIAYFTDQDLALIKRQLGEMNRANDIISFLGARADILEIAFKSISYRWFFGIGPESFTHIEGIKIPTGIVQPHSIIFQAITSWGLIGFLLLFSIFGRLLFISVKALHNIKHIGDSEPDHKKLIVISSTLIFSILMNATIDGTLYHGLPIYIFSTFSAVLIATQIKISSI